MKEIHLEYADLTHGMDKLVPVAMIMNNFPAIAFLPASVAESMQILSQFGTATTEDEKYKDLLDGCTVIIFDNPDALLAVNQLSAALCNKFLSQIQDRSKMI